MAITIQMDTTIDVVSKYNELVQEALGDESLHSRMKENLVDLLADGNLKTTFSLNQSLYINNMI